MLACETVAPDASRQPPHLFPSSQGSYLSLPKFEDPHRGGLVTPGSAHPRAAGRPRSARPRPSATTRAAAPTGTVLVATRRIQRPAPLDPVHSIRRASHCPEPASSVPLATASHGIAAAGASVEPVATSSPSVRTPAVCVSVTVAPSASTSRRERRPRLAA